MSLNYRDKRALAFLALFRLESNSDAAHDLRMQFETTCFEYQVLLKLDNSCAWSCSSKRGTDLRGSCNIRSTNLTTLAKLLPEIADLESAMSYYADNPDRCHHCGGEVQFVESCQDCDAPNSDCFDLTGVATCAKCLGCDAEEVKDGM